MELKRTFYDYLLRWKAESPRQSLLVNGARQIGKTYIKIFPDKPITKKAAETRMGSGKGNPEYFVAPVKAGRILFEVVGLPETDAREALRKAIHKLPIRCKIVSKEDVGGIAHE